MDWIWTVLVIIGMIVSIIGKSKGQPAKKPGASPAEKPKTVSATSPKPAAVQGRPVAMPIPPVQQAGQTDISGIGLSRETTELLRRLENAEKQETRPEEGSGSGSLKGTEESRHERTDATPRGKGEHTPERPIAVLRRKDPSCEECGTPYANAEHMREAVVMAEILNKPVSLRRQRAYR